MAALPLVPPLVAGGCPLRPLRLRQLPVLLLSVVGAVGLAPRGPPGLLLISLLFPILVLLDSIPGALP